MTRPTIYAFDEALNDPLNDMIDDIGVTHLLAMNYFERSAYATTDTSQQTFPDFELAVYPIRGKYITLDFDHKITGVAGQYNFRVEAHLVNTDGPLLGAQTFVWGGGTVDPKERYVLSFNMESIGVVGDIAGLDVVLQFFLWLGIAGGSLEISNLLVYSMETAPAIDGSDLLW